MKPPTRLASEYFDGDLQPDEPKNLSAWLLEDPQHVDDFVVDCFVHTQLIEVLGPDQVRASGLVAAETMLNRRRPA
jgi:hypothetical protein